MVAVTSGTVTVSLPFLERSSVAAEKGAAMRGQKMTRGHAVMPHRSRPRAPARKEKTSMAVVPSQVLEGSAWGMWVLWRPKVRPKMAAAPSPTPHMRRAATARQGLPSRPQHTATRTAYMLKRSTRLFLTSPRFFSTNRPLYHAQPSSACRMGKRSAAKMRAEPEAMYQLSGSSVISTNDVNATMCSNFLKMYEGNLGNTKQTTTKTAAPKNTYSQNSKMHAPKLDNTSMPLS